MLRIKVGENNVFWRAKVTFEVELIDYSYKTGSSLFSCELKWLQRKGTKNFIGNMMYLKILGKNNPQNLLFKT